MSSTQRSENLEGIYGLRYSTYEDPRSFEPYQLLLLAIDFILNWVMDWAHTDPLAILVIFVFQCLGLVVNLIIYIMASASQAMQSGLRKSLIYHHELNLVTCVAYITLTCCWYIWALRKSWPSVSDQFSFSFSAESSYPEETDLNQGQNDIMTTLATTTANTVTTSTTLGPILNTIVTQSMNKSRGLKRLLHNVQPLIKENRDLSGSSSSITREFYTLWSPGFIALYVIQRTVAIIHYVVSLKATYLLLNVSTIDNIDISKCPRSDNTDSGEEGDDSNGNGVTRPKRISEEDPHGTLRKNRKTGKEVDFSDSEINERRPKNFKNNSESLWHKKMHFLSTTSEPQNSSTQGGLQSSSSAHLSREISLSPRTRFATTSNTISGRNSRDNGGGGGDDSVKTKNGNNGNKNLLMNKRSALGEVAVGMGSRRVSSDGEIGIMG